MICHAASSLNTILSCSSRSQSRKHKIWMHATLGNRCVGWTRSSRGSIMRISSMTDMTSYRNIRQTAPAWRMSPYGSQSKIPTHNSGGITEVLLLVVTVQFTCKNTRPFGSSCVGFLFFLFSASCCCCCHGSLISCDDRLDDFSVLVGLEVRGPFDP